MNSAGKVKVTFQPSGRSVMVTPGTTAWEAARLAGESLSSICGRQATCGKCRVRLLLGTLNQANDAERSHLTSDERTLGYRLACQATICQAVALEANYQPPREYFKTSLPFIAKQIKIKPRINKILTSLPSPTLLDNKPHLERLKNSLTDSGYKLKTWGLTSLQGLAANLQDQDGKITCTLDGTHLIDVEKGDVSASSFGIAFDLGTTVVAAYLINLTTGSILATAALPNSQVIYGSDVISRINYASQIGLKELQKSAIDVMNQLASNVATKACVDRRHIYLATVVGNTCMLHLLLGITPKRLGVAPFISTFSEAGEFTAIELGLKINPRAKICLLPAIGAYVGADAVACILSSEMYKSQKVKLLIDIGTNAEIVIGNRYRIAACSAAAGPAFEGGHIRHGMQAGPGAINYVRIGSGIEVGTIGGTRPVGISGVGLVSAVASLLRRGLLDHKGLYKNIETLPPQYWNLGNNGIEVILHRFSDKTNGTQIGLSQNDISQLQLAKAAIRAGIETILHMMNLSVSDICQVLLAGSFGNYVNLQDALTIGLLPEIPCEKVINIGNAAGIGAVIPLISNHMMKTALKISRRVQYVELSLRPEFNKYFVESLSFNPPKQAT